MLDKNYNTTTLKDFIKNSSGSKNNSDHSILLKTMSRIAFNRFQEKYIKEGTTRVFSSIGGITQLIINKRSEYERYANLLKYFKETPFLGILRTSSIHAEDLNFVLYSDGKELYLFLGSESLNIKISQSHKFDHKEKLFIPSEGLTLIEFFINNKIIL